VFPWYYFFGLHRTFNNISLTKKKRWYIVNYGITLEEKNERIKGQDYKCFSCGDDLKKLDQQKVHIDHDHITGKIRGVLCYKCNISLGLLKEDINIINKLADYVKRCCDKVIVFKDIKKYEKRQKGVKDYYLYTYGITKDQKDYIISMQNNKCLSCGIDFKLINSKNIHIDHSHKSGNVRGVLCSNCNFSLGLLDENYGKILKLAEYARKYCK
jgi:hypothetical protein